MASRNPAPSEVDARARARQMQVDQQKKARRRRTATIWGAVLAAVLVIGLIVGFVVKGSQGTEISATGPVPGVVNEEGGVEMTSATTLADSGKGQRQVDSSSVAVPETATAPEELTTIPAVGEPADGEPAQIVVYADFNCVHCAEFESQNSEQLQSWLKDGKATVEYRMVNFLSAPNNKNYSARSANAAYCVAAAKPEAYNEFTTGLFMAWEGHGGKGLSDDELIQRADALGVDIEGCLKDNTYRPAVEWATNKAKAAGVAGTPTVFVDGKNWSIDGGDKSFVDWAKPMVEG